MTGGTLVQHGQRERVTLSIVRRDYNRRTDAHCPRRALHRYALNTAIWGHPTERVSRFIAHAMVESTASTAANQAATDAANERDRVSALMALMRGELDEEERTVMASLVLLAATPLRGAASLGMGATCEVRHHVTRSAGRAATLPYVVSGAQGHPQRRATNDGGDAEGGPDALPQLTDAAHLCRDVLLDLPR